MQNSHLENLPNEILLKVLHYLETKDLIRVSLVSQRIRPICHDETLWQTMNIQNGKVDSFPLVDPKSSCRLMDLESHEGSIKQKVPIGLVELILNNGCEHLRFSI